MTQPIENEPTLTQAQAPPDTEGSRFARAHRILLLFVLGTIVVWLLTGFYQVRSDQVALIERFGRYVSNADGKAIQIEHGLHYHLPWPIDRVHIVSTQQAFTMQVNAFNVSPAEYEQFKLALLKRGASPTMLNALFNPYLITADKCIAHLEVSVLFQINDPVAWLDAISHDYHTTYEDTAHEDTRNELFQQIAQRAIVQCVSRTSLDAILLEGRETLQRRIFNAIQDSMQLPDPSDPTGVSRIDLGVHVQKVEISDARVPERVSPAYNNLNNQKSLRDSAIARATADFNNAVTRATGERESLILEAQTYRDRVVQAARGEADRFTQVLVQFNAAPTVTRWNLWVDALRTVMASSKRIFYAQPGQKTVIVIDPPQFDPGQSATGQ